MQHEVDYVRAQHILQSLFHKGLLSADEFAKITAVNRKTFSPVLAAILPSIP
uniref:SHOCT domain-containing protein n=1 Tax=Dialister massiliensis TaxID=2161821 RepID=UPI002F91D392